MAPRSSPLVRRAAPVGRGSGSTIPAAYWVGCWSAAYPYAVPAACRRRVRCGSSLSRTPRSMPCASNVHHATPSWTAVSDPAPSDPRRTARTRQARRVCRRRAARRARTWTGQHPANIGPTRTGLLPTVCGGWHRLTLVHEPGGRVRWFRRPHRYCRSTGSWRDVRASDGVGDVPEAGPRRGASREPHAAHPCCAEQLGGEIPFAGQRCGLGKLCGIIRSVFR